MPRGRVHVDVTVHGGGHHHGHGHHHHHHGPGVGMMMGAAAVGAVAGAAVASSHNKPPPPKQQSATVVVVNQPSPQYGAPPPQYGAPGYGAPPPQYGAPPPQYGAPGYGAPPPHAQVYVAPPPAQVYVAAPPAQVTVVQVGPHRATGLGKKWRHGNIILLRNFATRKNLRINKHGQVEGTGGDGQWAQFMVERTGMDRVKLRSIGHGSAYLRCHPHNLDHGPGGPQCEFWVVKHGKSNGNCAYSLESVSHPGCYVGFHDNGSVKPPQNTGLGAHGSFHVQVVRWA